MASFIPTLSRRSLAIGVAGALVLIGVAIFAGVLPRGGVSTTDVSFEIGRDAGRQTVSFQLPGRWARVSDHDERLIGTETIAFAPTGEPVPARSSTITYHFLEAPASRLPELFGRRLTTVRKSCRDHADEPVTSDLPSLSTGTFMVLFRCPSRGLSILMVFKEADSGMLIAERYWFHGTQAPDRDTLLETGLAWAATIALGRPR